MVDLFSRNFDLLDYNEFEPQKRSYITTIPLYVKFPHVSSIHRHCHVFTKYVDKDKNTASAAMSNCTHFIFSLFYFFSRKIHFLQQSRHLFHFLTQNKATEVLRISPFLNAKSCVLVTYFFGDIQSRWPESSKIKEA